VTFAVPAAGVVAIALGAVVLTVVASLRPARRAAAVSILDAIAAD
jgi:ABC-type lipoprotein release transport system permease subunit